MAADSTTGDEIDTIKRLPGLTFIPGHFCAHYNGRTAFFYDYAKVAFLKVDLTFGATKEVKTEWPYKIRAPQDWCVIYSVERSSRTFILALILENDTNKFFIAAFAVSKDKIAVTDEHYLGVDYTVDSTVVSSIIQDEHGHIHCIIYYFNGNENKTIFHLLNVDIDENGRMSSKIIADNKAIPKNWCQPFVYEDTLIWLPKDDVNFSQLCELSLLDDRFIALLDTFRDENDDVVALNGFRITRPVLIEDKVFYYVCHDKLKVSRLLYFDCKQQMWRKMAIDMKDHIVIGGRVPVQGLRDGKICLHGKCSKEMCSEKYHIYIIDVATQLLNESQNKKSSNTMSFKLSVGGNSDNTSVCGGQELTREIRQAIIEELEAGLDGTEEYEMTAL